MKTRYRAMTLVIVAALGLAAVLPAQATDEPSPRRKAELEATVARRKARDQKKAQARAEVVRRQREAARVPADPMAQMLARQRQINEEIARADRYERERDERERDRRTTNPPPWADPAYVAARRLEAARLEAEIQRQAALLQQQEQARQAGNSLDSFATRPAQGQPTMPAPGGTATPPAHAEPHAPAHEAPKHEEPKHEAPKEHKADTSHPSGRNH